MVLVDTSIWIDHFRKGDQRLAALLQEGQVLTHTFIIEEIACGHLRRRDEVLGLLETLPKSPQADHAEFLAFIAGNGLAGAGLGAVDIHLLASTRLGKATLWSRDQKILRAGRLLGLLCS